MSRSQEEIAARLEDVIAPEADQCGYSWPTGLVGEFACTLHRGHAGDDHEAWALVGDRLRLVDSEPLAPPISREADPLTIMGTPAAKEELRRELDAAAELGFGARDGTYSNSSAAPPAITLDQVRQAVERVYAIGEPVSDITAACDVTSRLHAILGHSTMLGGAFSVRLHEDTRLPRGTWHVGRPRDGVVTVGEMTYAFNLPKLPPLRVR